MRKLRDELRAAQLSFSQDPSSSVRQRLWKQTQREFRDRVADVNLKVDRLNMIVPTLYQQIARFDAARELETAAQQCQEQTSHQNDDEYEHCEQSAGDSSPVTLTDIWRQVRALFTT